MSVSPSVALDATNPQTTRPLRVATLATVGAAITVLFLTYGLAALQSAGLKGQAPKNSATIEKLVQTLTDNWIWMFVTGLGGILVLAVSLLAFGSKSAPDWLFKIVGAIFGLMVVVPAILA